MTEAIAAQGTPLFVARLAAIAEAGRVPQAQSAATGAENAMELRSEKMEVESQLQRTLHRLLKLRDEMYSKIVSDGMHYRSSPARRAPAAAPPRTIALPGAFALP